MLQSCQATLKLGALKLGEWEKEMDSILDSIGTFSWTYYYLSSEQVHLL